MKTKPTKEQALDWLENVFFDLEDILKSDERYSHGNNAIHIYSEKGDSYTTLYANTPYECICKAMGYEGE